MKRPLQRHDDDSSKKRKVDSEEGTTCSTVEGVSDATTDEEEMEFDVFLSFRGPDTRMGFAGHLYADLMQRGVSVFMDSEDLPKGEQMDLLLRKIQVSKIFLVVLSKGYADSKWCLKELAKAVECGKKILPVFFNVEPLDVRRQSGEFFELAFKTHEINEELEKEEVRSWRAALKKAGSITGHHLQNDARGHEAKLIQIIAKDVMTHVRTNRLDVAKHPVGLESRVEEIKGMLLQDLEGNGVTMIGIHGMGGIGKTTLAKAVYNEILRNFDACSFLSDVRENFKTAQGKRFLQTQMIKNISVGKINDEGVFTTERIKRVASGKKVLVVLDDVDNANQLEALAGGCDWFGKGSRIIITTRDKSLLIGHRIKKSNMYAIGGLNPDDSMELFCYHAFRSKQPPDERYKQLAKEVVSTAEGLPLALELFGSQFSKKNNPEDWEALITKLREYPSKDVHERLKISYDELEECEKEVFLDIACFFIGRDKEYPMLMWEDCGFHPRITIDTLLDKSFIKMTTRDKECYFLEEEDEEMLIKEEVFEMHDQIRDMGRNIAIRESSLEKPGRRSRFWRTETIEELQMMKNPETVRGIELFWTGGNPIPANLWERHTQLRYLHGYWLTFQGHCLQLPAPMKWLRLTDCGLKQPSTYDFDPGESIVILELDDRSHLARAFVEQSFLSRRKGFEKLKVLDLSCTGITRTPDFSNVPCPNLEKMILRYCIELTTVHESIGKLKRLEILNLTECTQLSSLPITLGGMTSLKKLMLERCTKLSSLPDTLGDLASLEELMLKNTQIETLHDRIGHLRNLKQLSLAKCTKLSSWRDGLSCITSLEALVLDETDIETLPDWIGELRILKKLSLKYCEKLSSLPDVLRDMTSLEVLVLDGIGVQTLPDWIGELANLRVLSLDYCARLEVLPHSIRNLSSLKSLRTLGTSLEGLMDDDGYEDLRGLYEDPMGFYELNLSSWEFLYVLPDHFLRGRLRCLCVDDPTVEALPESMGQWGNLGELSLNCKKLKALPESISSLRYLEKLEVSNCQSLSSLPLLPASLTKLSVLKCKHLRIMISSISHLISLTEINLCGCSLVRDFSDIGNHIDIAFAEQSLATARKEFNQLKVLDLSETGITTTPDFNNLSSPILENLILQNCKQLKMVHESVTELRGLRRLDLTGCDQLSTLPKRLGDLTSLVELSLDCTKLETIPDSIAKLKNLRKLSLLCYEHPNIALDSCGYNLTSIPLLPLSLAELHIVDCINLQTMASVSHLTSLTTLCLSGCSSLRDVPGMNNITNTLKNLILPGPGGSLQCNSLNDHFKRTVLQKSTFDALCHLGLQGGTFCPNPGAGRQHSLCFMLPRYVPWTSCKEITGELFLNGGLCKVNDHEEAHWRAHVKVVADDGLTVVTWMRYTFLPGNTIVFRETDDIMRAMILGRCCSVHVFLELPEELKWVKMALNLNFLR